MEDYGKHDDFVKLAKIWVHAICKSDLPFTQEMNPITGNFAYVPVENLVAMIDALHEFKGK